MRTTIDQGGRLEGLVEVLIMLAVAGMAGAASFTHVHDWTMRYSPAGTGDWFGWANAMVTELIPTAAGLEARRRKRLTGKAGAYPVALILGAIALSLVGQFSEATPSVFGWIVAAVPAVGFGALVKLILSRPTVAAPGSTSDSADLSAGVLDVPAQRDPVRSAGLETAPDEVLTPPVFMPAKPDPAARVNGYAIGSGIVR